MGVIYTTMKNVGKICIISNIITNSPELVAIYHTICPSNSYFVLVFMKVFITLSKIKWTCVFIGHYNKKTFNIVWALYVNNRSVFNIASYSNFILKVMEVSCKGCLIGIKKGINAASSLKSTIFLATATFRWKLIYREISIWHRIFYF